MSKDKLCKIASQLVKNADNDTYTEMLNDLIPDLAERIEDILYNGISFKELEQFVNYYKGKVK